MVGFYSSELKGAPQLIAALRDEDAGNVAPGRTRTRYRNTLTNLALIDNAGQILPPGREVLDWANANTGLVGEASVAAEQVDSIIYRNLLSILETEPGSEHASFFKKLLANLSLFIAPLSAEDRVGVAEDLELLYVLQMIHSNGQEIARLWWLPAADRQVFTDTWVAASKSWDRAYAPVNPVEATIHAYLSIPTKIQKDVRYRVRGFLKAWLTFKNPLPADALQTSTVTEERIADPQCHLLSKKTEDVALEHPRQLLLSGCPGSGKSHLLSTYSREADNVHKIIRTTFHAETSYFDFVGSFRPAPVYIRDGTELFDASGEPSEVPGRPSIDYRFVPGPMARAYLYAVLNPTWKVILLIEEINRANASAVFGDILQLLDREAGTFRSRYSIEPQPAFRQFLAQSRALESNGTMRLPANLYLWATMNNADQGVQPIDSAFRRRWSFKYLGYQTPCADPGDIKYAGGPMSWDTFRSAVNKRLLDVSAHEDKLIGPYFLTRAEMGDPAVVLNKLFLYLWDDVLRYQRDGLFAKALRSFADVESMWRNGEGSPIGNLT